MVILTGMLALTAFGQDETLTLDDVVQSARDWARENLDTNVVQALEETDQTREDEFLDQIRKELEGEYVIDLAPLKGAARSILPLLEAHDQTLPYAIWLKTRLDYLDAAEELRLIVPPPKSQPTNTPPPIPQPEQERELWIKKLADRPWPDQARPYVNQLKPVFAEEKVPPQLVWIAEVESSFDSRARSPAGAAGMFQLMPATAKRYGLRIWPFDQRYNAEKSARAAAQYLAYLHNRFRDWRLALAAYNAGEGTVQKLLDGQKNKSYDAIAARLPAETQLYVPKVEATLERREGVTLADLSGPRG